MVCPLCKSADHAVFIQVKDHTVSQETYDLAKCNSCGLVYTLNPPQAEEIHSYYQSSFYISHTDSNESFFDRCYQVVRKRAIAGKKKLIETFHSLPTGRLLDYGCGTGSFLAVMKDSGWRISGIEKDPGAQQKARSQTGEQIFSPDHLGKYSTHSFDVVTLWHVLEHVHELDTTLNHFHRVLDSNGLLIVAVPNLTSLDAQFYGPHWAAYDVPRHLYHFSPDTMVLLLKNHGFEIVSKKPMWFDSFYVSLLSERYKKTPLGFMRACVVGLISNIQSLFNIEKCSSLIYIFKKSTLS